MNIESLVTLKFSQEEVREGLLCLIDCKRNDEVVGSPEYRKLSKLIKHAQTATFMLDFDEDGSLILMLDGVCFNKKMKVL